MARKGLSLLLLIAVTVALGCGAEDKDSPPADKPTDTTTDKTALEQVPSAPVLGADEQKLVGVWLGQAFLEDKLVEAEFETKPTDQEKVAFVDQAEAFLSTIMAIEFKPDGTFEQDIEQAVSGIRQIGKGTWRVVDSQEGKLIVETVEKDAEGNEVAAQRLFQLYPDGKGFAMPAPVSESLAKCNPLLVFSLQNEFVDNRTADAAETKQR